MAAVHEVGHALAAYYVSADIYALHLRNPGDMTPRSDAIGRPWTGMRLCDAKPLYLPGVYRDACRHGPPERAENARRAATNHIAMMFAGPLAEARHRRRGLLRVLATRECSGDVRVATEMAADLEEHQGTALREGLAIARTAVRRGWRAVPALAERLVVDRTVPGVDVEREIDAAWVGARDDVPLGFVSLDEYAMALRRTG